MALDNSEHLLMAIITIPVANIRSSVIVMKCNDIQINFNNDKSDKHITADKTTTRGPFQKILRIPASPDLATEWPWQADGIHGSRKELGGPGSGKAPHPSSSPPIPSPPLFASPSPLPALDLTTNLILHLDSFVPDE